MSLEIRDSTTSVHQALGRRVASFFLTAVGTASSLEGESEPDSYPVHESRTWFGIPPIEECVLQGLSVVFVNDLFDS